MAFAILGQPLPQYEDLNGDPMDGGVLEFDDPVTGAGKVTYPTAADADAATNPNATDLTLNSRGEPENQIWGIDGEKYKVTLKDASDSTIWVATDLQAPGGQNNSNSLYYELSSKEQSAGVTPTDYSYEWGDVRRYGAVADAGTDQTTVLQAALDSTHQIYFPEGTFEFTFLEASDQGIRCELGTTYKLPDTTIAAFAAPSTNIFGFGAKEGASWIAFHNFVYNGNQSNNVYAGAESTLECSGLYVGTAGGNRTPPALVILTGHTTIYECVNYWLEDTAVTETLVTSLHARTSQKQTGDAALGLTTGSMVALADIDTATEPRQLSFDAVDTTPLTPLLMKEDVTPADGDMTTWDATNGKWVPINFPYVAEYHAYSAVSTFGSTNAFAMRFDQEVLNDFDTGKPGLTLATIESDQATNGWGLTALVDISVAMSGSFSDASGSFAFGFTKGIQGGAGADWTLTLTVANTAQQYILAYSNEAGGLTVGASANFILRAGETVRVHTVVGSGLAAVDTAASPRLTIIATELK